MEKELAAFLGVRHSLLVNSGSSRQPGRDLGAHLPPSCRRERRLQPGDEVITVAAGFPTTVAPIVQVGAVPVFIDADPITGNARCDQLEAAYRPGQDQGRDDGPRPGQPLRSGGHAAPSAARHDLWLVEDNCDALGCSYSMPRELAESLGFSENSPGLDEGPDRVIRWTGTWGDLSTQSFYPPHHLTMGEGGAVNIVRDQKLKVVAESFRDWGRDCWCPSGMDNTCNKRFDWQLGELPEGYDHKYTYSHLGFNLKPLDPQAAIGRVQLRRLPEFIEARKRNWQILREGLVPTENVLEFSLPTHATGWDPERRLLLGRQRLPHRLLLVRLQDRGEARCPLQPHRPGPGAGCAIGIGNRMLFGGNLLRQPAFVQLRADRPDALRVVGDLAGADEIMIDTLFLGTYPGLTAPMLAKEIRGDPRLLPQPDEAVPHRRHRLHRLPCAGGGPGGGPRGAGPAPQPRLRPGDPPAASARVVRGRSRQPAGLPAGGGRGGAAPGVGRGEPEAGQLETSWCRPTWPAACGCWSWRRRRGCAAASSPAPATSTATPPGATTPFPPMPPWSP